MFCNLLGRLQQLMSTTIIDVCQVYEIRGFPTLKMFGQDGEPVQYASDRSLVSLMKFANAHAG